MSALSLLRVYTFICTVLTLLSDFDDDTSALLTLMVASNLALKMGAERVSET